MLGCHQNSPPPTWDALACSAGVFCGRRVLNLECLVVILILQNVGGWEE